MRKLVNYFKTKLLWGPAIAVLATALTLGVCEFSMRAYNSAHPRRPCYSFEPNKFLEAQGHSMEYGYYPPDRTIQHCAQDFDYGFTIDGWGFRGYKGKTKQESILAMGDSFTFGFGVNDDQTFSSLLGAYNAGVFAAPFPTQVKAFNYIVPKVKPSAIIWDIYAPHIITMTPSSWITRCPGDRDIATFVNFERWLPTDSWNEYVLPALKKLALFNFAQNRTHINSLTLNESTLKVRLDCYFTKERMLYEDMSSDAIGTDELRKTVSAELDDAYKILGDNLRYVAEYARSNRINLQIILIPSKYQLKLTDSPETGLQADRAFQKIRKLLHESGVAEDSIIDLTPVFSNKADRPSLFFESDAHWTAKGHRHVADFIRSHLK